MINWNKIKLNAIDISIVLIALFSLTTQYQSLFKGFSVNRIIGAGIFVCLFLILIINRDKDILLTVFLTCVSGGISLTRTDNLSFEMVEWVYLLSTSIMVGILSNKDNINDYLESVRTYKQIIEIFAVIECLSFIVMLIFKIGYSGIFFVGLCNAQHTTASLCCLLLSMILISTYFEDLPKVFWLLLSAVPLYTILECGTRVFLVPGVILALLIINKTIKEKKYRLIVYLIWIALIVFLFAKSSMLTKFKISMTSGTINGFTSSRINIWENILVLFDSGTISEKIFGMCFRDVYLATNGFWAHNDILYLLVGGGIVTVLCYLYVIVKSIVTNTLDVKEKILLFVYVLFNMLFNGFMTYQHFVYSYMLLFIALHLKSKPDGKQQNRLLNGQ